MMTHDTTNAVVDRVMGLLQDGGGQSYFGEPVTQLEHALQTASLAESAGAPTTLIVAALLHDIGHLVEGEPTDEERRRCDARHEEVGNRWLSDHFGAAVTEPVRLHVAAKRYLCAIDPGYAPSLSEASRESLEIQGGPMSQSEVRVFEETPWASDAARLRRWDDAAKIPGRHVPTLPYYRSHLRQVLKSR